jgi:ABC-2 type transport system permease protein
VRGFRAFLAKELTEIVRTWRIWVLPGIVLFFALSGPPLAKVTPDLLRSLVPSEQGGMLIRLPEPTYVDAYLQWTKNLSQIVLFTIIIAFGGMISAEKRSGTAALVLTKPISRGAFVAAKYVSQAFLVLASTVAGALITWGVTFAVFAEAPVAPLVEATAAWLAFALLLLAVMELLSAALDSSAGAAGLGLAAYLLVSLAALWGPAARHSPAGLVSAPSDIVAGKAPELAWPVATACVLTGALVAGAVAVFRRREI